MSKKEIYNKIEKNIYNNFSAGINILIEATDKLIGEVNSTTKNPEESYERVANILVSSHTVMRHSVAEHNILKEIIKKLNDQPENSNNEKYILKAHELISEEYLKEIKKEINIRRLKIPTFISFGGIEKELSNLISELMYFIICLTIKEVESTPEMSSDDIINFINTCIKDYISVYEKIDLIMLIDENKIEEYVFDNSDYTFLN